MKKPKVGQWLASLGRLAAPPRERISGSLYGTCTVRVRYGVSMGYAVKLPYADVRMLVPNML